MNSSIYDYVIQEENRYQTEEVVVGDNWYWNMRKHIQLIFHLKNGIFYTGENNWLRAFKNIMEPILNLSYWSEDIEVKDVVFYIENKTGRVLSFLVKKYHDEVFVKEHNLDTLFDEITESDLDYGGAFVQKTNDPKPEVFQLNTIAFCDQTDIFGGPVGFKHHFTPDKLRGMSRVGWGEESNGATTSIDDLIVLADKEKAPDGLQTTKSNTTTGKTIEVYIVRGNLPESYLKEGGDMAYYCNQVQILAFYTDKKNKKIGVTLYRKKEKEGNFKFHTSKKVHGRALGRGVGEALLGPQIWTNFLTIHKTNMLEAASKVPLVTDDPEYTNRNKIQDMDTLEITTIQDGRSIKQIPTAAPVNIQLYEKSIDEWYVHAQFVGSAQDPMLGKESSSGTTFRGQERLVAQGRGLHDRRRGQRAKFVEEIYREEGWIIDSMVKEILKGKKFLSTLTSEEMTWVSDQLAENYANKIQINSLFDGEIPVDKAILKQKFLDDFSRKGNQHILEILKEEFEGVNIKMGINIANKQKDLGMMADKVLSIFQYVGANPEGFIATMKIPGMANALNDILEFSGISQVDFSTFVAGLKSQPVPQQTPQEAQPEMLPAPVA